MYVCYITAVERFQGPDHTKKKNLHKPRKCFCPYATFPVTSLKLFFCFFAQPPNHDFGVTLHVCSWGSKTHS